MKTKLAVLTVLLALVGAFELAQLPMGCSTISAISTNTAEELTIIGDIQAGGDAAAGIGMAIAQFTGNQTLSAQILVDVQQFDGTCADARAAISSGTNVDFTVLENDLKALVKNIEASFTSAATPTATPATTKAIVSARTSIATVKAKIAKAKLK